MTAFIGVEPERTGPGIGLSGSVRSSLDRVCGMSLAAAARMHPSSSRRPA